MDVPLVSRVLWQRGVLRRRERWGERELAGYQRSQVAALRAFAVARSPFYRRFHEGLENAPLSGLPVLTKATLMDSFDQISTDPAVRIAGLQAYLEAAPALASGSGERTGCRRPRVVRGARLSSPATLPSGRP